MVIIIDWASNGVQRENNKDIMYLVSPSEEITFSGTTDETCDYRWEVNKVDQGINSNDIVFTVPNEKEIWEIHLKVSSANGEDHVEWVVSTLSIDEAPDFFEYFADKKYTNRTETDPWGRALATWTYKNDDPSLDRCYARTEDDGLDTLTTTNASGIVYGTWEVEYRFPSDISADHLEYFNWRYIYKDGNHYNNYFDMPDGHEHMDLRHPEASIDPSYDSGIIEFGSTDWYKARIIRKPGGELWIFKKINGGDWYLHFRGNESCPTSSVLMWFDMNKRSGRDVYMDNFAIYKNKYLFPEKKPYYGEYVQYHYAKTVDSEHYLWPKWGSGIILTGETVNLSYASSSVNDPSLITYDEVTKTCHLYTDLVINAGSELRMKDETLVFHGNDGERRLLIEYGSTLNLKNSTIKGEGGYWLFDSSSGITQMGLKTVSYISFHEGAMSYPGAMYGQPMAASWRGLVSLIAEDSTFDNFAHLFLDSPHTISLNNVSFTNVCQTDIGDYSGGPYAWVTEWKNYYKDGAGNNRSITIWYRDQDPSYFQWKDVTITNRNGEPLDINFAMNDDRMRINLYNTDFGNNNVRIRKSVAMYFGGTIRPLWPQHYETTLGLVNCKWNDLYLTVEPDTYSRSDHSMKWLKFVPKYYLDVKVIDTNGDPVSGAVVNVENLIDLNYPIERFDYHRDYITTQYGWHDEWPYSYRIWNYGIQNSAITGSDGHTPLPSDSENTLILPAYKIEDINDDNIPEKTTFSYQITAEKNGVFSSVEGIVPNESWYRENPENTNPINTVVIILNLECPKPISLFTHNAIFI